MQGGDQEGCASATEAAPPPRGAPRCCSRQPLTPVNADASYAKAHSRLGYAYFHTERYADAVDAYRRALQLNPDNASAREYLRAAEERLGTADGSAGGASGGGVTQGQSATAQPDLASMLNDPNAMGQASSMMQNPAVMQM